MQHGVQNAAVVVLLLTPGIFHAERHFVWKTEIKYALEEFVQSIYRKLHIHKPDNDAVFAKM